MDKCQQCDAILTKPVRGRPQAKFCSRKCHELWRHRQRRAQALAEAGERKCRVCGTQLPDSLTLKAKCCSPECSVKWQNQRKAARKHDAAMALRAERPPCPRCGSPVPLMFKVGTVYCSKNCQQLAWNARTGYMRQYKYGIALERFEAMLAEQDGRCAICRTTEWGGKDSVPHVDHNEETGKVRKLLCANCNNGIGMLGHDPARLRAAAEYLEAHQE